MKKWILSAFGNNGSILVSFDEIYLIERKDNTITFRFKNGGSQGLSFDSDKGALEVFEGFSKDINVDDYEPYMVKVFSINNEFFEFEYNAFAETNIVQKTELTQGNKMIVWYTERETEEELC